MNTDPEIKIDNDGQAIRTSLRTANPATLLREFVFNAAKEVSLLPPPPPGSDDEKMRHVLIGKGKDGKLVFLNRSREIPPDEAERLFGKAYVETVDQTADGLGQHGIGAKLMGLCFSPLGTVFHWKHAGKIYMMKLYKDGEKQHHTKPVVVPSYPIQADGAWVMVTLLGSETYQQTWNNPVIMPPGTPGARWTEDWVQEQMRLRHWKPPFGIRTALIGAIRPRGTVAQFVPTFYERLQIAEQHQWNVEWWSEGVFEGGIREITYVWDPDNRMFGDIKASQTPGFVCLGYELQGNEEFYDVLRGSKLSNNASRFNLSGVHRFVYIIVTLDTTPEITPTLNRLHLQQAGTDLSTLDYADVIKEHMPQRLKDLITAMRPRPTDDDKKFSSDLIKQLGLTVQAPTFPKASKIKVVPDPNGTHTATLTGKAGPHNVPADPQKRAAPYIKGSTTVVSLNPNGKPRWAKPTNTVVMPVPLPEPEVTRLETPDQVKDYQLEGRIGRYETTTNTLYVNTLFGPAIGLIAAVTGSPEAQALSDLGRDDVTKLVWNEIRQLLIATALRARKWSLDGVFVDGEGYEGAKEYEAATNGVGLTAAFAGAIHHHLEPRAMKIVGKIARREAA